MYLDSIILKFIQPCTTDYNRIRAKAVLSTDISDILPYINSHIKNGIYNDNTKTYTFSYEGKLINFHSKEVNIAKLINETEAFEIIDYLKEMINNVYEKRDDIIPSYETKRLPSPLEVYNYLPKLNCGFCGQATCLAFANKLIKDEYKLKRCKHIHEEGNIDNLQKLKNIIILLGYDLD